MSFKVSDAVVCRFVSKNGVPASLCDLITSCTQYFVMYTFNVSFSLFVFCLPWFVWLCVQLRARLPSYKNCHHCLTSLWTEPEPKPFAKRYGSFNVNIKKTLHHLNLKNWEGLGGLEEDRESHNSLPPLHRSSRKLPKRAKRTASLFSSYVIS